MGTAEAAGASITGAEINDGEVVSSLTTLYCGATNPQLGGAIADIVGIGALTVSGVGLLSGLLYRLLRSQSENQVDVADKDDQ
jgi:hypothetical protein